MPEPVQFKAFIRGAWYEVRMWINSMDPISFEIQFVGDPPKGRDLTRLEISQLCRVAAQKCRDREKRH